MTAGFKNAPENRYFEDYVPGDVHEFGAVQVDDPNPVGVP